MKLATLGFLMLVPACFGSIDDIGGGQPDAAVRPDTRLVDAGPDRNELLIKEWSGCQTIGMFTVARMATSWANLPTNTGQRCGSCHSGGAEGFLASDDPAVMFKGITEQRQFLLQYFTVDSVNNKMIVNVSSFRTVTGSGHPSHPRFDPDNNSGMTALRAYYSVISDARDQQTCDPPRLVD